MNNIIDIETLMKDESHSKDESDFMIDNLILSNTSIILGAREKIGKSTLALQLVKSIMCNEKMLDFKSDAYHIDSILFYSNDSSEKSIKLKLQKMNVEIKNNFKVYFIFDQNLTIHELFDKIGKLKLSKERVLLIVDVLSGIRTEEHYNMNDYLSMTECIDQMERCMKKFTKSFGILYLHHLTKNTNTLMGSRAIASRVSAVILMSVDDSRDYGVLDIVGNDIKSRKVYIKKDKKKHIWLLDKKATESNDSDLDYQLLRINETLCILKDKKLVGDVNKIVAETRVNILPRNLTRWLKTYKRYLNNNNIYYVIRKSGTTIVELYLKEK